MRAVTSLPHAITETDDVRIPVSDGTVLVGPDLAAGLLGRRAGDGDPRVHPVPQG